MLPAAALSGGAARADLLACCAGRPRAAVAPRRPGRRAAAGFARGFGFGFAACCCGSGAGCWRCRRRIARPAALVAPHAVPAARLAARPARRPGTPRAFARQLFLRIRKPCGLVEIEAVATRAAGSARARGAQQRCRSETIMPCAHHASQPLRRRRAGHQHLDTRAHAARRLGVADDHVRPSARRRSHVVRPPGRQRQQFARGMAEGAVAVGSSGSSRCCISPKGAVSTSRKPARSGGEILQRAGRCWSAASAS